MKFFKHTKRFSDNTVFVCLDGSRVLAVDKDGKATTVRHWSREFVGERVKEGVFVEISTAQAQALSPEYFA